MRLPLFKNIFDSGIINTWFSLLTNALLTSAAFIVGLKGSNIAMAVAFISYLFLATQTTHGTRSAYEHLKEIYVYGKEQKITTILTYSVIFIGRAIIMILPISIFWWAYTGGEIPF